MAVLLSFLVSNSFAAPAVVDTDGDGIPDSVELALGQNPGVFDSYPDADGDGIPDIIETMVTGTNPAVDDRNVCTGGGASGTDLTGQWDVRIATNLATPIDFKADTLSALSICHTAGGLASFHPKSAYATSNSIIAGTYSAAWASGSTISATYTAGGGAYSLGRLEGTFTENGVTRQFRADRRLAVPPAGADLSALYGLQIKQQDKYGNAIDRPTNPLSYALQTVTGGNGVSVVSYFPDGTPMVGYYARSVGAVFFLNRLIRVDDADGDTFIDDLVTDTVSINGIVVAAPSAKVGGMLRGTVRIDHVVDLDYLTSPGINSTGTETMEYYSKAQVPQVAPTTYNSSGGTYTSLSLNNVPTSADQISVAGDGLASTDIVGGTSGISMDDAVSVRSRIPGFTDGESVGLSGNGTNLNVTRAGYNSPNGTLLINGNYSFTLTGDADSGTTNPINFTYTQPASLLLVAGGVTLDGSPMTPGVPVGDVTPGNAHALAWTPVAGAAVYVVKISRVGNNESNWHFTASPSMTLDARFFDPMSNYSIRIEARAGTSGEAANNRSITDAYRVNTGATFADVPTGYFAWKFVEGLAASKITSGCGTGPLIYCPDNPVTRAQMAIFLERGIRGPQFAPPAATGTMFADVPLGSFAAAWIEQLATDSITSGCGGGNYCPNDSVTRAQMAIFLLRAEHGAGYTPPAATGTMFTDVPLGSFGAPWIEQLATEGITSGCGGGNYCPNNPVTRGQMAIFLVRTFQLPTP